MSQATLPDDVFQMIRDLNRRIRNLETFGKITMSIDESLNKLVFRVVYADGVTVKTGSVTLS